MKITNFCAFPVFVCPAARHEIPPFTVDVGGQSPDLPDALALELIQEFPERWTAPVTPPLGEKE